MKKPHRFDHALWERCFLLVMIPGTTELIVFDTIQRDNFPDKILLLLQLACIQVTLDLPHTLMNISFRVNLQSHVIC